MQIVLNEELKEALEWTCGLVEDKHGRTDSGNGKHDS